MPYDVNQSKAGWQVGQMNRVVIAEDEALLVDVLTELFQDEGFEVAAFSTADAAWLHLHGQANPPDLLFTDVKMPGCMDGLALAAAFIQQWPDVPVVICSGHAQELAEPYQRALFFPKPWTFDRLSELCRNVKGKPR